jgi:hypothetical protein
LKKVSTMTYDELYDLVVTKGGVNFGTQKPRRSDLEGALDEIDPDLVKDIDIDTVEFGNKHD